MCLALSFLIHLFHSCSSWYTINKYFNTLRIWCWFYSLVLWNFSQNYMFVKYLLTSGFWLKSRDCFLDSLFIEVAVNCWIKIFSLVRLVFIIQYFITLIPQGLNKSILYNLLIFCFWSKIIMTRFGPMSLALSILGMCFRPLVTPGREMFKINFGFD